jgi:putative NADPH-quinone reductase
MPLRVFILYANPVAMSFGAALQKQTVVALRSRGHEIDDCDLHAESFNPVMSEEERMQYHDVALNRGPIWTTSTRRRRSALTQRSSKLKYLGSFPN